MYRRLRTYWPLLAALGVLGLLTAGVLAQSIQRTDGKLVYVLDDTYIHMAIAKSFAQTGTWGVTRYEFSASASSLIWPILLAISYKLFGTNEASPIVLNGIFALVTAGFLFAVFRRRQLPIGYTCLSLVLILLLMPMLALLFGGQEHIFHSLVTMAFVYTAAVLLERGKRGRWSAVAVGLCMLAPFMTLARYEGLFVVVVVCVLFACQRRWGLAVLLGVLAIAPAGVFAAISVSRGWCVLPNPVLLKSSWNLAAAGAAAEHAGGSYDWLRLIVELLRPVFYERLLSNPHLLLLLLTALLLFVLRFDRQHRSFEPGQSMLIIFAAATVLHMQFARTGWFYRYEAYLVSLGLFVIMLTSYEGFRALLRPTDRYPGKAPVYVAWLCMLLFPLCSLTQRALEATLHVPRAAQNIYQQQYQMARFLRDYYNGATIAASDIGAINFLADLRCVDLVGLANVKVARRRQSGTYTTQAIRQLCQDHDVQIAVLYEHWFRQFGGLPAEWTLVGCWKIPGHLVCRAPTVCFYAVEPLQTQPLIANLRDFAARLPKDVIQDGLYLE